MSAPSEKSSGPASLVDGEDKSAATPEQGVAPAKSRVRLRKKAIKKKVTLTRRKEEEVASEPVAEASKPQEEDAAASEPIEDVEDEILFDGLFEDEIDPNHPEEGLRNMVGAIVAKVVPKIVKRVVVAGGEKLTETDLRQMVKEASLSSMPKDVSGLVVGQLDNAREEFFKILAREIQQFLESLNLTQELQKVLTSLSLEVRTEIRFIPNDKAVVKPSVKNRVRAKWKSGEE